MHRLSSAAAVISVLKFFSSLVLEKVSYWAARGNVYGWEGGKDEEGSSVRAQDQGELLLSPHLH